MSVADVDVESFPRAVRATVVRAAVQCVDAPYKLGTIAANHDLNLDEVKAIVQAHGWPRPDSMMRAAGILEREQPAPNAAAGQGPEPRPAALDRVAKAALAAADPVTPTPNPEPARTSTSILNEGKLHTSKRIRNQAEKVTTEFRKLKQMLDEDRAKNEARAEIARLQAELAAAKARLKPGTAATVAEKPAADGTFPVVGEHACEHDGCDRTFPTKQGLSLHGRRAHGGAA